MSKRDIRIFYRAGTVPGKRPCLGNRAERFCAYAAIAATIDTEFSPIWSRARRDGTQLLAFYVDLDGNGALGAGEPSATSAADGSWQIAGVPPGSWLVREVQQGGYSCTAPADCRASVTVSSGVGDYRSGDEIWLERLPPDRFAGALNRDVLVPRPAGRFIFGRLIGREGNMLHILPPGGGQRQTVVTDPPWAAVARSTARA